MEEQVPPTPLGSWPLQAPVEVQFRDLDILAHVNNAVHFTWMENLRTRYFVEWTGSRDLSRIEFVLAEATCRYRVPIRFHHEVRGEIAPGTPLGNSSWTFLYRFWDAPSRTLLAQGRSVQVAFDPERRTKIPLRPEIRAKLQEGAVDPRSEGWGTG